jgi:predicted nucleotidyltransferase component of viral defense system
MLNSDQINFQIKKVAKELGIADVNRVRTILTLERIIARLVNNPFLKERLIFGGGFVLFKESGTNRFTKDADAIINDVSKEKLIIEVEKSITLNLNDGFWFGDATVEEISTESGYGGYRFKILNKIGDPPTESEKKNLKMIHLDISIGVDLEDVAQNSNINSVLNLFDPFEWKVYPKEFIAAEKIHCLLDRGDLNTRGKDVYDLAQVLKDIPINKLSSAIVRTFNNRNFKLESFYNTANVIDTEFLKENFNKTILVSRKQTFDECWKIILNVMIELDR